MNTGTSKSVGYLYADGTGNSSRPTQVTYPSGTLLNLGYGSGTPDDLLSRISSLALGSDTVASYNFLGVGTPVVVNYPDPNIAYTLATGSNAHLYSNGLDIFGRVINCLWQQTVGGTTTALASLGYGYDFASNRQWRRDNVAESLSKYFDEYLRLRRRLPPHRPRPRALDRHAAQRRHRADLRRGLDSRSDRQLERVPAAFRRQHRNPRPDPHGERRERDHRDRRYDAFGRPLGAARIRRRRQHDDDAAARTPPATPTRPRSTPGSGCVSSYDTTVPTAPVQVQENQYDGRNFRVRRIIPTESGTETRDFYHSDSWQVLQEYVAGVCGPPVRLGPALHRRPRSPRPQRFRPRHAERAALRPAGRRIGTSARFTTPPPASTPSTGVSPTRPTAFPGSPRRRFQRPPPTATPTTGPCSTLGGSWMWRRGCTITGGGITRRFSASSSGGIQWRPVRTRMRIAARALLATLTRLAFSPLPWKLSRWSRLYARAAAAGRSRNQHQAAHRPRRGHSWRLRRTRSILR